MPQSANRFRFTLKALSALKPSSKPQLFYDTDCVGLGVRLSPKGKRAFFHQQGSKRRTLTAKTLQTARQQVHAALAQAAPDGYGDWTLGALFQLWMETKAKPKKRTWKRDQSRFEMWLKHWSNRRLSTIKRIDVIQLHNQINEESGPHAANDTADFVRSLYNYAETTIEYEGRNPASRIEKFPTQDRERYLLPEEFPRWHKAVHSLRLSESRDFFLLLLWTGIRREAVLAMQWAHVDLAAGTWTIPPADDKGKRSVIVYLSDEAIAVLKRRQATASGPWVLPSPNGSGSGHYANPRAAWETVLKRADISNLRIHDLRRTLGSWMAEGGTNLHIIGKVLGHKSQDATRIYARLGGTAVRNAVNSATQAMRDTLDDAAE